MANIKSLQDLGNDGHSSDDDGGGFNDYYAGGEKSGQLIRGAPKQDEDDEDDDKVSSLFNKAKKAGAQQGTADDLRDPNQAFQGTGRTLAGGSSAPAPKQSGPIKYVITFYRNGIFTVNDGPPRRIDDPANASFIRSIGVGECPEELEPEVPNTPINVNLVRKEEDYTEPAKPRQAAFVGTGRTLGSEASTSGAASIPAQTSAEGEWAGVDEGKPTTSLQLRLADGSRMVARFNHTHRISDIRRFIRASRPDINYPYSLTSGMPPAPIADEERTLEAAGLLNAVIIQRK